MKNTEDVSAPQQDSNQIVAGNWVPVIVKHATEHHDRIMYLDTGLLFTRPIHIPTLLSWYDKGSMFGSFDKQQKCNPASSPIQLVTRTSDAFKHYLSPFVECSRKQCSDRELQLIAALGETQCEDLGDEMFLRPKSNKKDDLHFSCYVIMREDFIFSMRQLPTIESEPIFELAPKNKNVTHVALGFPSTSKGNKKPTLNNIPLISILLPSLLQSIDKSDHRYKYTLYMAIDESDDLYSQPEVRKRLHQKIMRLAKGYPIEFQIVQCVDSHGWVSFLWNAVFQYAMDDGADYFYQINDDVRFVTQYWTEPFINMLQQNPLYPGLGVTGPFDKGDLRLFTQAFVSRVHYEIFGYLYPYIFKNWFSDDWLSQVYTPIQSSFRVKKFIHNTQSYGTRYEVCNESGLQNLKIALRIGIERVKEWAEEKRSNIIFKSEDNSDV
ncbi:hypothetical protein AKO1_008322 [Acrasis kona]|uniref:Hexosyltransferase n=1 Tax=Acrasis kona TaxID=1008807 RepID=A0AAW2YNA0_9EUKA